MFLIHEILDLAIRLEKNGESVYRNAVDKASKPELVSLLEWMADEEVKHASWFSNLKQKVVTDSINPFMAANRHLEDICIVRRLIMGTFQFHLIAT